MGVQLFYGLATCPDNGSSKIPTSPRQYESSSFLPLSYSPILGGACSTRSQFREGTRTAEVNGASNRFPGMRVDGTPSGPSEASAKKRESNVGSFKASSVCMSRVKKRSLRRAVKRAQSGKCMTLRVRTCRRRASGTGSSKDCISSRGIAAG